MRQFLEQILVKQPENLCIATESNPRWGWFGSETETTFALAISMHLAL